MKMRLKFNKRIQHFTKIKCSMKEFLIFNEINIQFYSVAFQRPFKDYSKNIQWLFIDNSLAIQQQFNDYLTANQRISNNNSRTVQ